MFLWYGLAVVLALVAACEYYAFKTGVPTVTSFPSARKKMIEILGGEADKYSSEHIFTILDLGSGTGKLALEIGKALPSARVVGLEISPIPFLFSLLRKRLWRTHNVAFIRTDFWAFDLSKYDAIVIYMNANIRERMGQKLEKELRRGAIVITNETYLQESWIPEDVYSVGLLKLKMPVYRKK